MSELVVFTVRENFDFLEFNSRVSAKQQEALKADCIMVQETQKLTAQTFGVWALRLVDLRDGGCWEDVINPKTGLAFFNEGFGAFCKHAFGLSETATSNLTKVAQFIQNHGDNVGELMGEYRGYSFSQLVELSSVSPSNRKYFSSDMTVKEMRTAKNYMKMGGFFQDKNNADFDLLKYSTGFEEERKSGVAKKNNPEVIPGQIELEDISDNVGVHINPTSELANAGERVSTEEEREELLKNILLFESWRDKRKRIYDKYKSGCSMYEFLLEVKTEYMFKSCSTVKGGDMQANSKGFVISFPGIPEFFVDWEEIASRIVTLINRGEYYTEDDERIEQARAEAHKAGIPFYEGDEEEFNPYVYDGKMSVEDYKLMHEQMDADKAADDYDELDEAQADMQAEMQTIEEESERSLPKEEYDSCELLKGAAPWLKPDFKNRDGIREFYQSYMSWEQLYCRVPCVEVYRYKFKIGTLYAVSGRVAGILEPRETREIKYSVRYFWQDKGDARCYETSKIDLEKFIPLHKDEL